MRFGRASRRAFICSVRSMRNLAASLLLCVFCLTLKAQDTNYYTPAQYLAMQPKPNFALGHHLPHLTQWNWGVSSNTAIELANNWGYALMISGYTMPSVVTNLSAFNKLMQLCASSSAIWFS